MTTEIITLPCLSDNYAFLIHTPDSHQTILIDAPEPAAVSRALARRDWRLTHILLTHHHGDHTDGADTLRAQSGAEVYGAEADAHRLPRLDHTLTAGQTLRLAGHSCVIIDTPGHTIGHMAFHFPGLNAAFTADSLMAQGCGRLFEGTAAQMLSSLRALAALPDDTIIYSGHEYTLTNARFALTIEPDNPALIRRAQQTEQAARDGRPTVPSPLALEKATNPFLRAHLPEVKAALDMKNAPDVAVFAEIRARKDRF